MNARRPVGTLPVPGSARHPLRVRVQRCLRCSRALVHTGSGEESEVCSEACKKAVQRARQRLQPTIRSVVLLCEGEPPPRPLPPFWGLLSLLLSEGACSDRCLRCSAELEQSPHGPSRLVCGEACKKAVQRRRPGLRETVALVLAALQGRTPEPRPPFWELLRQLASAERTRILARRRLAAAAARLPVPPSPTLISTRAR